MFKLTFIAVLFMIAAGIAGAATYRADTSVSAAHAITSSIPVKGGNPTAEIYSKERTDGTIVSVGLVSNGTIGITLTNAAKQEGVGYSARDTDLLSNGKLTLTKTGSFGTNAGDDKVQIRLVEKADGKLKVTFHKVKNGLYQPTAYTIDGVEELDYSGDAGGEYHCHTSSGTGSCDNVNTDSDWRRCFMCCLALGCS